MDRRFPVLKGYLAGPGICKKQKQERWRVRTLIRNASKTNLVEVINYLEAVLEAVLASSSLPTSFFCIFDDTT